MTEVKDISTETKTCKIYQDVNGTYVVEFINGELAVMAGAFSTVEKAEEKGNELLVAEHVSGEMLVGDVLPTEAPTE
jgi:hypothetical protein